MYRKLIKKNINKISVFIASLFFLVPMGSAFADVAVVANNGIGVASMTAKEAKKIWLGKSRSLGGVSVKVVDLPKGNTSRNLFYSSVVKKSEQKLKGYWAKIVFSGKGIPPKIFKTDAEVVHWVAKTPGALGYVDRSAVDDSVKVLLIIQ